MSNEIPTIHEFDFKLICEYFASMERQGPGSPQVTLKALDFIDNLSESSQILDLGCGTGGQTMVLAQHAPGQFTGIDLFSDFIDIFNRKAKELKLDHRVKGKIGSMDKLEYADETFDVIWSEGAIYNIGYARGLEEWNRYLRKGGYIAVTEASWFTDTRPAEITDFWMNAYAQIATIPEKVSIMQQAGYIPVASFILPENCWTEHFYVQQIKAQELFLHKYPDNPAAAALVANERHEAELYKKYKDYYGYVFYIGKKL